MTRYALAPDKPILLRPDGAVQLGWDPRRAVLVRPPTGMTPDRLAQLLRTLQDGATRADLLTATAGSGADGVDELIGALTDAGLVSIAPGPPTRSVSIRVHGRGPLSELLTNGLRCTRAKVGHSTLPHLRTIAASTDLVVLADYQVTDPQLRSELHRDGIAHLPVRVRDGTGLVGPLVIPGTTCCLHCCDLHRTDRDAAWPAVASQLRGAVGSATRATILATAALALRQVDLVIDAIAHLGGRESIPEPPATLNTTLELDPEGFSIAARRWSRHPDCAC